MALSGSGGIRQLISLVGSEEVKAAFDRIGASGQATFRKLQAAANSVAPSLTRVTTESHKVDLGLFRLVGELTQTTQKMQFLSEAAGGLVGGLTGLVAFEAGIRLFGNLGQGLDRLNDIRKTAANLKLDPDAVKGFGEAMRQSGLSAADAAGSLTQFAGAAFDAQKDVAQLGNPLVKTVDVMKGTEGAAVQATSGISTLRGAANDGKGALSSFVQVMRGDVIAGLDQTGAAFSKVGVDIKNFKLPAEFGNAVDAVARNVTAFNKAGTLRPDALRDLQAVFKIDDAERFLALMDNINNKGFKAFQESAKNLPPTKQDVDNLRAYNAQSAEFSNKWNAAWDVVVQQALRLDTFLLEKLSKTLDSLSFENIGQKGNKAFDDLTAAAGRFAQSTGLTDVFTQVWAKFAPAGSRALDSFVPTFQSWATSLGPLIEDPWTTFKSSAGSAFDAIGEAFNSRIQIMTDAIAAFGQAKDEGDIWAALKAGFSATLQSLTDSLNSWIETAAGIFTDLGTRIQDALTGAFNWISDQITSLSSSLSSLFGSIGTASGAPGGNLEGFAGGGMVRGPGTGTSDSVPIWASDGEWMMRAKAVNYWGVPFMAAINSLRNPFKGFSMGGLVTAMSAPLVPSSAPRFASGGMVTATATATTTATTGGGTTVVLNIGGVSHRLSTDDATGDSLIRLSRKHRMLAA